MNTFTSPLAVLLAISTIFLLPTNPNGHVFDSGLRMPTDKPESDCSGDNQGTRWAVLVAGSSGFGNYRHQADVCHAYQLLKNDGLKDENIVVFMYDDIANHYMNPKPGIIINHPKGEDVYNGVPKDYTGDQVTAENLYAVLLGDRTAVTGGSGKVVDSKSNDRIFLYYSDHGGPGVLGMPNLPYVYARDFIEVLKKKHEAGAYKEMLVYIEACESGSMFEGIMPEDMGIYVTTASNAQESSFGTYCPGMNPAPPPEFATCLGDLYSVAWMEDSECHNLREETIDEQYKAVRNRVSNNNTYATGSHVMEYGSGDMKSESLCLYQGFKNGTVKGLNLEDNKMGYEGVDQRDAELVFLFEMYKKPGVNKEQMGEKIRETIWRRTESDASVKMIGALLFGVSNGVVGVRESGIPLVDDWECLKSTVRVFERGCGTLTQYGMKHMRAFANICNAGIERSLVEEAVAIACGGYNAARFHPFFMGYSA